ncbi:MAG: tetratricopeptide repeat protein [Candidatus Hodarchaeales archaeon]|jgi:tetratricopeptide (TPR) repeat protein
MDNTQELQQCKQFISAGKLGQALEIINSLEKSHQLSDDEGLICSYLKSDVFYRYGQYQKAMNLSQNILLESKRQGNQLQAVDALIMISTILWRIGKFPDSQKRLEEAEKIIALMSEDTSHEVRKRTANLIYRRGTIYSSLGELNKQMKYAKEALGVYEEIDDKKGISNCFNVMANIIVSRGDLDNGLALYKKALNLNYKVNDLEAVGMVLGNLGMIHLHKGEFDQALKSFQKAISIDEEIGNKIFLAERLIMTGFIHSLKGSLNEALGILQRCLNISEEMNTKQEIALTLGVIGLVYIDKGELSKALTNIQKCLSLLSELGIEKGSYLSYFYRNLGRIYSVKGNLEEALKNFKRSLTLDTEIGNNIFTSLSLFSLVKTHIDMGSIQQAEDYIEELQRITQKEENTVIEQIFRVCSALLLKTSGRTIQRAEAQKLFQDLSKEKLFSLELAVDVLLNLSDLLLDELKSSGSDVVLKEIKSCFNQLLELSKKQYSAYLLCETYLLQSKLALLEMKPIESSHLLSQAELIAEEKGLGKLSKKIYKEREITEALLVRFEKLADEKPSMTEIIEVTQLESLFDKMLKKRVYRKQEEVLEYASEALSLVQSTGK